MSDPLNPDIPVVRLDPDTIPMGEKFVDWVVQLAEDAPEDEIILDELLETIVTHNFADGFETIQFECKWFESIAQDDAFNLMVFRQSNNSLENNGGPSPTPGPTPKKPPGVVDIQVN